jgi:hypothetical protein
VSKCLTQIRSRQTANYLALKNLLPELQSRTQVAPSVRDNRCTDAASVVVLETSIKCVDVSLCLLTLFDLSSVFDLVNRNILHEASNCPIKWNQWFRPAIEPQATSSPQLLEICRFSLCPRCSAGGGGVGCGGSRSRRFCSCCVQPTGAVSNLIYTR